MKHFSYAIRDQPKSGVKGLKDRFEQQITGPCGPGTNTWKNHDDEIRGGQDKLRRYAQHYQLNCNADPPEEIVDLATRPRPKAEDWKPTPGKVCEETAEQATELVSDAAKAAEAVEAIEAAVEGVEAVELLELLPLLLL